MLEYLFNKVEGFQACNFIKKILQHSYFPVNIVKFLRISIWKISADECFSKVAGLKAFIKTCIFLYFPVTLTKFLRTSFLTEHLRWLLLFHCMECTGCYCEKSVRIRSFLVRMRENTDQKNSKTDTFHAVGVMVVCQRLTFG